MMVYTYSLKSDGSKNISRNFTIGEFACKDGSDSILISLKLVEILQMVRDYFKKPVTINSAYRNKSYNKRIGGATYSQHIYGTAADIVVKGVKPEDVAKYVEHIMPNYGGIGLYLSFVHVDVRANRSRWKNYGREVVVSGFPGFKELELTDVSDIVSELTGRGVITNSDLWLNMFSNDINAYWLGRKICNLTKMGAVRNPKLETVNDIVWELGERGVISDKHLWMNLFEKDINLYWLGYKAVNMTTNK